MALPSEHLLTQRGPHSIQIAAVCAAADDDDDACGDDDDSDSGVHYDHDEDAVRLLSVGTTLD